MTNSEGCDKLWINWLQTKLGQRESKDRFEIRRYAVPGVGAHSGDFNRSTLPEGWCPEGWDTAKGYAYRPTER